MLIEDEEALGAVEKNSSGSRPKDLFDDVLEEVEEVYAKDRSLLRDAKLEVTLEMPYSDFAAAIEGLGDDKLAAIPDNFKWVTIHLYSQNSWFADRHNLRMCE